jgi:predicted RecB family nuclease
MSSRRTAHSRDSVAWGAYPVPMAASNVQGRQHRSAVKGVIMQPTITSEVVVAYAQCPRKAYLLLFSPEPGEPHEYVRILERQQGENHKRYLDRLQQKHTDVQPYTVETLRNGSAVLLNACLQADGLAAVCDALTRVEGQATGGPYRYEPTMCVGTHSISKEQKLALAFTGYVLGCFQHTPPMAGRLIAMDGTSHTVTLGKSATDLMPLLEPIQAWTTGASPEPPPIVLNKHCPLCPFQRSCHAQAEQEDNLTLLNGVTARVKRQYEKKGIFTVKQLSYLFKPRKRKKRSRKPSLVTHKVELQALAIRENKIYLQNLPALSRQPIELFLDMEGVPDRGLYYLMGLLVCQPDTTAHYSFWADTDQDERHMWQQFLDKVNLYPEAPIYHYGSYEARAIAQLAKRYDTDAEGVTKRLVNVNRYIYGQVYFPVRSNGLKDIGAFIGAKWTSPQASGLQSLVWRHHWDTIHHPHYKHTLLTYNAEDCQSLKLLTDELAKIQQTADVLSQVDFADQPKRNTTETSEQIHSQFESILTFAHANYDKKKIKFRQIEASKEEDHKRENPLPQKKYYGNRKIEPRPTRIIQVPSRSFCVECDNELHKHPAHVSRRIIIDLVLTKNSIRKTIIEYIGDHSYCRKCNKYYIPPYMIGYSRNQLYGHGFRSWIVYNRVALRMPYSSIREIIDEQFNEKVGETSINYIIKTSSQYYEDTERNIIQNILKSPFIHADETSINIKGENQYVWTFTDGNNVVFKLRASRESTVAHEFLADYDGILISDFYPGYDSVQCQQQKCWVHLIRDLNDDLWRVPFNTEFEYFVLEVRNLIIPIMETIQIYGLRKLKMSKFKRNVDVFYEKMIMNKNYKSDITITYQKRFIRYRESLFTFLEHNGIPWHNNTAETALRHLTIQENISRTFYEGVTPHYLRLLGIRQTCRFQGKSFFKFLFSGETDLEKFESRKRKR